MRLTRRGLLKGFSLGAGASLLSPFLGRLHAAERNSNPKRVVFVLQANGFHPWEAQPKNLPRAGERMADQNLAAYELPDGLAPLKPFIDRTTIVQRLNGRHTYPSHSAKFAALGGTNRAWKAPLGETIDAALARALPAPLPLVNLGITAVPKLMDEHGFIRCCSAWGANRPIGTQMRPENAWRTLFGSVAEAADAKPGEVRALDSAKTDVAQVHKELSPDERQALDRYLEAFDAADKSQRIARKAGLDDPRVKRDERFGSELHTKQLAAQFDLAAAALIGGLTNVVTICSGGCDTNGNYQGLGVNFPVHPIGHFQGQEGKIWQELYTLIRRHHAELVAGLARKLDSIPEGDGSMLDNTLIVYTSDGADTHHSKGDEWPFVFVGSLGGKIRTGRFLEYPAAREAGNRTINALYCTLLEAAGAPREHFNLEGQTAGVDRKGPLEDLLAS